MLKITYLAGLAVIVLASCSSPQNQSAVKSKPAQTKIFSAQLISKSIKNQNDTISIKLSNEVKIKADSLKIEIQGNRLVSAPVNNVVNFNVNNLKTGTHTFRTIVYYNDSLSEVHILKAFIWSNVAPKKLSYKVKNTIPHDMDAYTQGLFYSDGFLYESTGSPAGSNYISKLRKIAPETGEVLKEKLIGEQFFGEGSTRIGDNIYVLTYKARIGFIYDFNTFEEKERFPLQLAEGWGLTNNSTELIMSNGSKYLYFYDASNFNLNMQLEVADNNKVYRFLNELEYTPYGVFSNVYGNNEILLINEKTGAVKSILDLTGLIPKEVPQDMDHVLNGIAWKKDNIFYITGKLWPVIYEIEIIGL